MDHEAAALAFDHMAAGLHAAAGHLVGPGLQFTRTSLDDAAVEAARLAGLHRAAARTEQAGDYVRDLLGPGALARVESL